jgi:hypothetical protein
MSIVRPARLLKMLSDRFGAFEASRPVARLEV